MQMGTYSKKRSYWTHLYREEAQTSFQVGQGLHKDAINSIMKYPLVLGAHIRH